MPIELDEIKSGYSTDKINSNFEILEDAINNRTLKRRIDEGEANEMHTHLDMNLNKIVNMAEGENPEDAVTYAQMLRLLGIDE